MTHRCQEIKRCLSRTSATPWNMLGWGCSPPCTSPVHTDPMGPPGSCGPGPAPSHTSVSSGMPSPPQTCRPGSNSMTPHVTEGSATFPGLSLTTAHFVDSDPGFREFRAGPARRQRLECSSHTPQHYDGGSERRLRCRWHRRCPSCVLIRAF